MAKIGDFYRDKTVFITGGTGFIGKIIIEKLLRSADVGKIYMLIREKKGVNPEDRLVALFKSPLFDFVKNDKPEILSRVVSVTGNIEEDLLGLSASDQARLASEVEVVFHCAATVRFDEDLSRAVRMNVGAVWGLVRLARTMRRLVSLVHVSTAYCHCQESHIKESSYPAPMSPTDAMNLVKSLDKDILDAPAMTKSIIGNRPNTYTFTKAIAEELILSEAGSLPVCIVRPSIVVSTWREPTRGWVDNLNGPTGLFLVAGIGVMRTAVVHEDLLTDGVPVDTCANLTIASAWNTDREYRLNKNKWDRSKIKIFNYTSGNTVPLKWGQIYGFAEEQLMLNPLEGLVWYPEGSFKKSVTVNRIYEMVLHELPARLTDLVVTTFGKEPFALRLCNKMQRGMRSLEYFTTHQWTWENGNAKALAESMDETDRETFNFNLESLDWYDFIHHYVLGTRKFVLKQDPSTIPACRRKLMFLKICDRVIKLFFLYFLYRIFVSMFL